MVGGEGAESCHKLVIRETYSHWLRHGFRDTLTRP